MEKELSEEVKEEGKRGRDREININRKGGKRLK